MKTARVRPIEVESLKGAVLTEGSLVTDAAVDFPQFHIVDVQLGQVGLAA